MKKQVSTSTFFWDPTLHKNNMLVPPALHLSAASHSYLFQLILHSPDQPRSSRVLCSSIDHYVSLFRTQSNTVQLEVQAQFFSVLPIPHVHIIPLADVALCTSLLLHFIDPRCVSVSQADRSNQDFSLFHSPCWEFGGF